MKCKPLKLIPIKQGELKITHPVIKREYEWRIKRYREMYGVKRK